MMRQQIPEVIDNEDRGKRFVLKQVFQALFITKAKGTGLGLVIGKKVFGSKWQAYGCWKQDGKGDTIYGDTAV